VNIGRVPTAGADRPLTVEAHLIGWQKDCYDAPLALECIQRVREERRFPSFADLVTQIRADIGVATGILRG
jgi:riboflavin kinase/FMN adenylyltransferase